MCVVCFSKGRDEKVVDLTVTGRCCHAIVAVVVVVAVAVGASMGAEFGLVVLFARPNTATRGIAAAAPGAPGTRRGCYPYSECWSNV